MNRMDDLILRLTGENEDSKRWIDTKTGWNQYSHSTEQVNLFKTVGDVLHASEDVENMPSSRTGITVVRDANGIIYPWRKEEALERAIVLINKKEKAKNQHNLSGAKEAVDIVLYEDGIKWPSTFIELKPWNSNNSPAFAIVELIKNYWLAQKKPPSHVKTLMLLAPFAYYSQYDNKRSVKQFLSTIKYLTETTKVGFKLAFINRDLSEIKFCEFIQQYVVDSNWNYKVNTKKYNARQFLDLKECNLEELHPYLHIDAWQYISEEKHWPPNG